MRVFIMAAALLSGCIHKAPISDPLVDEAPVELTLPSPPTAGEDHRLPPDLEDEAVALSAQGVAERLKRTPTPRPPTGDDQPAPTH